jgi:hypothetical protein
MFLTVTASGICNFRRGGKERGIRSMTPELKATETRGHTVPATDRDELAEILLYVWLRSEVNEDWGLPLVIKQ